jgi:hypothetical protein
MRSEEPREIRGKRIDCDGRKVIGPSIFMRTSGHRGQRVTVKGDPARCYIERVWGEDAKTDTHEDRDGCD